MSEENVREYQVNIGCVIVTYNRLEKLKRTLESYSNQKLLPKYVIVVNNASTDQTSDFLKTWSNQKEPFEKIVITTSENLGGSGGFYVGEKKAMELNSSWIMIADDDAYPEPDYILGMAQYLQKNSQENISIICGKVVENDSFVSIHRSIWRSKWDRNFHKPIGEEFYKKEKFNPDFVSYVGILLNKEKLKYAGLVCKGNFIWCDDTEHTYRMSQEGRIVCLPSYSIIHDVEAANDSLSWKYYYGYRNDLIFFKKHFKFHFPVVLGKLALKTLCSPLIGRTRKEFFLRFHAMYDALIGKMGVDNIYKPGWKP
ncbi:glycosyltransferase [Megasphaera massiliensis]|uniref:glycosyltransferase n=1 Tax=Megasphaera massiliensis TaxID=1232428 RepID=UPI00040E45A8|nr:glycosyltransferase [Megasphaera massiliensis]